MWFGLQENPIETTHNPSSLIWINPITAIFFMMTVSELIGTQARTIEPLVGETIMQSLNKILVIIEQGWEDQPALEQAIEIAESTGAELHAFMSVFERSAEIDVRFSGISYEKIKHPILLKAQHWLDQFLQEHCKTLRITNEIVWHKKPHQAIAEVEQRGDCDLIIKSCAAHPGVNKLLFKPGDWHLIHHTKTPLLFVKQFLPLRDNALLLAISPETNSTKRHDLLNQKLLQTGAYIREKCQSELHLAHVPPSTNEMTLILTDNQSFGNYVANLQSAHKEMLASYQQEFSITPDQCHSEEGNIGEVINATANEISASLIVAGSHCREGIEALIVGNAAESILENCESNLLIIKLEKE